MEEFILKTMCDNVRAASPLVHSITNYVTVNDCANALLACGASPIMSDEPEDVGDIASICNALTINIGTLNAQTIESMLIAGRRSAELEHPIVLDPVGAGASALRTRTAADLLEQLPITVIRGNMSEVKALAGETTATRGVDACPDDAVTEENLEANAAFARALAEKTKAVVAITGAIDLVTAGEAAFAISNGTPLQERITGAGCMLSCMCAAYAAANPDHRVEAQAAAVIAMGLAGQIAERRMASEDGNGSFRTYLLDALYLMDGTGLEAGALVRML